MLECSCDSPYYDAASVCRDPELSFFNIKNNIILYDISLTPEDFSFHSHRVLGPTVSRSVHPPHSPSQLNNSFSLLLFFFCFCTSSDFDPVNHDEWVDKYFISVQCVTLDASSSCLSRDPSRMIWKFTRVPLDMIQVNVRRGGKIKSILSLRDAAEPRRQNRSVRLGTENDEVQVGLPYTLISEACLREIGPMEIWWRSLIDSAFYFSLWTPHLLATSRVRTRPSFSSFFTRPTPLFYRPKTFAINLIEWYVI